MQKCMTHIRGERLPGKGAGKNSQRIPVGKDYRERKDCMKIRARLLVTILLAVLVAAAMPQTMVLGEEREEDGQIRIAGSGEIKESPGTAEASVTTPVITKLEIEDDLLENGDLIAKLTGDDGQEITDHGGLRFVWYRSKEMGLGGADGYKEVSEWERVGDDLVFDKDDHYGDSQADMNVAKDQGGLHWYFVEVTDDGGNVLATTKDAPIYIEYAMELQNGSFEEPSLTGTGHGANHAFLVKNVPHWGSTSHDGQGRPAVEIASYSAKSTVYGTNTESDGTVEEREETGIYAAGSQETAGKQFAEINAQTAGALYQDVLTAPGTSLVWSLYHRARTANGTSVLANARTNTMYLVIMSGLDAKKVLDGVDNNHQQSTLVNMLDTVVGDGTFAVNAPYTLVSGEDAGDTVKVTTWLLSTTSIGTQTDWQHHSGDYEVPDDQYVTRFFFVAKSGTGDATMGNLLDLVEFSQTVSYNIDYYLWDRDAGEEDYSLCGELGESGSKITPYTHIKPHRLDGLIAGGYSLAGSVTGTATGGTAEIPFDETTHDYLLAAPGSNYLSLYLTRGDETAPPPPSAEGDGSAGDEGFAGDAEGTKPPDGTMDSGGVTTGDAEDEKPTIGAESSDDAAAAGDAEDEKPTIGAASSDDTGESPDAGYFGTETLHGENENSESGPPGENENSESGLPGENENSEGELPSGNSGNVVGTIVEYPNRLEHHETGGAFILLDSVQTGDGNSLLFWAIAMAATTIFVAWVAARNLGRTKKFLKKGKGERDDKSRDL